MKKRILLIDDDALVLKTLEKLFARADYETRSAKDGNEAETTLRAEPFDLIICDVRMPGKDGISVMKGLKEICQKELKKDIPCIFITGYASEETPIDAIKLGARDYILKPFDLDELLSSVKRNIG